MGGNMGKKNLRILLCVILIAIVIIFYLLGKVDITKYTISNEKIPEKFNYQIFIVVVIKIQQK